MRRNTFPLRPQASDMRMRSPAPAQPAPTPTPTPTPMLKSTRKVFNCIVDDTALIAGVKRSTRDGIRKWVSQGAIRLFVPLHTLAQLDRLKKGGSERINRDAHEAIKWLDEITEMPDVEMTGRVLLEGVDEAYPTWAEVEQFLLAETLFSQEDTDSEDDEDEYAAGLESSFHQLDVSDGTSMSSTHSIDGRPETPRSPLSIFSTGSANKENASPAYEKPASLSLQSPDRTARNSVELPRAEKSPKGAVPVYLQPLFNHILWRINKEPNPNAALDSFIFLTNDPAKQMIAQKFGVRAKRLEQLRDTVAREDRELKNRLTIYNMEVNPKPPVATEKATPEKASPKKEVVQPKHSPKSSVDSKDEVDSDDEDVVLLKRAPRGPQAQANSNPRVWDPNDFGRANQQQSPRGGGARGGRATPRGRGGPVRGRGAFASRGASYVPPGPAFRAPPAPRANADPNQPLDPDSFARPVPRASTVRGRRKLWEPN